MVFLIAFSVEVSIYCNPKVDIMSFLRLGSTVEGPSLCRSSLYTPMENHPRHGSVAGCSLSRSTAIKRVSDGTSRYRTGPWYK